MKASPRCGANECYRAVLAIYHCVAFTGILLLISGCDTPYTRRVGQLDQAYQQGDLSREDYMRFVHDAEHWEAK